MVLLKKMLIGKRLIVFGTGTTAAQWYEQLTHTGIHVDCFTDNNSQKWMDEFQKRPIISPGQLQVEHDVIIIASEYEDEIAEQLERIGFVLHENCLKHSYILNYTADMEYCWNTASTVNVTNISSIHDIHAVDTIHVEVNHGNYHFLGQSPNNISRYQYPSFMIPQQTYPSDNINVYKLKRGITVGTNGSVLTEQKQLIREFSSYNTLALNVWDAQRINMDVIKDKYIANLDYTVAVTTTQWGGINYYHWMMEELPRFYLLSFCTENIDYYISNYRMRLFQKQTLEYLGIPLQKIIRSSDAYAIQASQLVVPYSPAYDSGYIPQWVCDFLKQLFNPLLQLNEYHYHKYIYIARGNAHNRKVENEQEVIQYLEQADFKIIYLEHYSVQEQVNIFYNAEVIVAPHGAGLTNLVFCRKETKVLEIFQPMYAPIMFRNICENQQLAYHCAVGERTDFDFMEHMDVFANEKNIRINMQDIKAFVSLYM
ncbi:glycosyltransferase family 61 protein [Paenibacillus hunanensis]|uniref:glycosyltransferase family 61 protein n=1 Tax=Paenibacillus hunanensis TaxID=539262 RepID=UPI0020263429|nr:glycosyltransferase family 61 protein [Paenibacillus hunanensis]MCL9662780.1 glycosyltransferase family 61 protein [Paenibacillus hunanensis]